MADRLQEQARAVENYLRYHGKVKFWPRLEEAADTVRDLAAEVSRLRVYETEQELARRIVQLEDELEAASLDASDWMFRAEAAETALRQVMEFGDRAAVQIAREALAGVGGDDNG